MPTSKPTKRDESLHILQHALGLDDYGQGTWYRNHYVTGDSGRNFDLCMAHVEVGRMTRSGPSPLYGCGGYCFTVTDAGKEYVAEHSPKPPKNSKAKKRYESYLSAKEANPDLSFRDFLQTKDGE